MMHPAAHMLFNRPLALWRECPELLALLTGGEDVPPPAHAEMTTAIRHHQEHRPYDLVNGVAMIPVTGILFNSIPEWSWGFLTSYGQITAHMRLAVEDPEARAVAMIMNSPGGEVAGCFDACDVISGLRGAKPIWAILDDTSYSAAYALASTADRITVPRTGGTGSIGIVAMHADITGQLEKAGIKVSTIQFGARKTDLYPTSVLSDSARAKLQADVDSMGILFVETVARNRGLDPEKIAATEAATFLGAMGVDAGLADAVISPAEAFKALCAQVGEST